MLFDNNIETLLSESKSFSLEGYSIFYIGKDHLPHIVCTCPNKDTARAIMGLLVIAKKAQEFPSINACITSNCYLAPKVLADGTLGMVAAVINDAVYKDGAEVEYEEPELQLGTPEYDAFIEKLRQA